MWRGTWRPAESRRRAIPPAHLPDGVEAKLLAARAALALERLWPRLWPALMIALAFLSFAFFDLPAAMPGLVHAALLVAFAAFGLGALFHAVRGFIPPSRADGLSRLEADSALAHEPLQDLGDRLGAGVGDAASEAIWHAHRLRARRAARALRLGPPRPDVPRADPFALRVAFAAFALIGFLYAGPERGERLAAALSPDFTSSDDAQVLVDAWITPPDYTGTAPVYLATAKGEIAVPTGSRLTVRVSGAERTPSLRRLVDDTTNLPEDWQASLPFEPGGEGTGHALEVPLTVGAVHEVRLGRTRLAAWPIAVVADAPPRIAFAAPPKPTAKSFLGLSFRASDDFGLEALAAHIRLTAEERAEAGTAEGELVLLEPAAIVTKDLPKPAKGARTAQGAEQLDLTAHPWAGREVDIVLEARDAAGQTGESRAERIVLPERIFLEPLAKAVIEQRALLAAAPRANRNRVSRALDALAVAPERFLPDTVTYLSLRVAHFRLKDELTAETFRSVYDLLWNLALHIEDGDLTLAAERLKAAQQALMDALADDAAQEEIAELMAELRAALDRYLAALAENVEQRLARGEELPMLDPSRESLSPDDLARMMQSIEDMAATGSRDGARQMLSDLQRLLDNLSVGSPGGRMSGEQQQMSSALEELSGIIRDQKALLDETFRRSGEGAGPSPEDRSGTALTRDQAALRERLERLTDALKSGAPADTSALEEAGEAMGEAQDALAGGEDARATPHQRRALKRLQEGGEDLAEALSQAMGSRVGRSEGGRDPLGRSTEGANGDAEDESVKVPSEQRLQRARRILEELQKRAGEPSRSREELDYIDRLLRRF